MVSSLGLMPESPQPNLAPQSQVGTSTSITANDGTEHQVKLKPPTDFHDYSKVQSWISENKDHADATPHLQQIHHVYLEKVKNSKWYATGDKKLYAKILDQTQECVNHTILGTSGKKSLVLVSCGDQHHLVLSDSQDRAIISAKSRQKASMGALAKAVKEHSGNWNLNDCKRVMDSLKPVPPSGGFMQRLVNIKHGFKTDAEIHSEIHTALKAHVASKYKCSLEKLQSITTGATENSVHFVLPAEAYDKYLEDLPAGSDFDPTFHSNGVFATPDETIAAVQVNFKGEHTTNGDQGGASRSDDGKTLYIAICDGSGNEANAAKAGATEARYLLTVMKEENPLSGANTTEETHARAVELFESSIQGENNPLMAKSRSMGMGGGIDGGTTTALAATAQIVNSKVIVSGGSVGDGILLVSVKGTDGTRYCRTVHKCAGLAGQSDQPKNIIDSGGQIVCPHENMENGKITRPGSQEGLTEIVAGFSVEFDVSEDPILIAATDGLSDNLKLEGMEDVVAYVGSCPAFDQVPDLKPPNQYDGDTLPDIELESGKNFKFQTGQPLRSVPGKPGARELKNMFPDAKADDPNSKQMAIRLRNYVEWINNGLKANISEYQRINKEQFPALADFFPFEKYNTTRGDVEEYAKRTFSVTEISELRSVPLKDRNDPCFSAYEAMRVLSTTIFHKPVGSMGSIKTTMDQVKEELTNLDGAINKLHEQGVNIQDPHVKKVLFLSLMNTESVYGTMGKEDDLGIIAAKVIPSVYT